MLTRNALSVTGFLATVLSAAAAFEPPLPWTQHPEATATILEVPEETSMSLLSEEEQAIFTISPKRQWGSTSTGSIFLSQYQNSSSVAYNELIVASGTVQYSDYSGSYLKYLWVDNEDALEAGRDVWGLDKRRGEFTRTEGDGGEVVVEVVDVETGEVVITAEYALPAGNRTLPVSTTLKSLSVLLDGSGEIVYTETDEAFGVNPELDIAYTVGERSPLAPLLLDGGVKFGASSMLTKATMDVEEGVVVGKM